MMEHKIKASLDDIPILEGYLHDAYFSAQDLHFDKGKGELTLKLERICYEQAEKGKFLFIIPILKFPWMESVLTVTDVKDVSKKKLKKKPELINGMHMLLSIERRKGDVLQIKSYGIRIDITVSDTCRIFIKDISLVKTKSKNIDFLKGVFRSLEEIEKLKIQA